MPFDALVNNDIKTDASIETTAVMKALKNRSDWNNNAATQTSPKIDSNAADMLAAFVAGHSHDGTKGQGPQIITAGIADNAVNDSDMIKDLAVTGAKMAANLSGADFDTGAATPGKWDDSIQHVTGILSGSVAVASLPYNVAHGLGRRPVVIQHGHEDFYIVSTDGTNVQIDRSKNSSADPITYSFRCI